MHIIILTQYYPPETGAPQNRLSDMARRFKARGFDVHVLTAKPNYPNGIIAPAFRRGLYNRTLQDQVPVIHCLIFATRSKKIILRLLNYFSFVLSSALTGAFLLPTADLLIVESPPLFLSISAWFLSRLKRARLILNISDLYPETAISLGMLQQPWLQKLFYAFEAWSYQKAALVTIPNILTRLLT
jgi:colanic acid biosynthesis glycosyl transferase WcaI